MGVFCVCWKTELNCPAEYTQIKGVLSLLWTINFCVVKRPGATSCSTGSSQDKPRENYKAIANLEQHGLFLFSPSPAEKGSKCCVQCSQEDDESI